MKRPTGREIYVWQLPVRVTHWTVALAFAVLAFTGIYIGNPYLRGGNFLMLYIKEWHLVFAIVLICAASLRCIWLFMGNRWSSWRAFVPFADPGYVRRLKVTLRFWLLLGGSPSELGHNPLAALAYVVIYGLFVVEALTGFALNSMVWGGWWRDLFGWIVLMFPANDVRLTHHLIMWLILAFVVQHVYSVMLVDVEEQTGLTSSIISGYKFDTYDKFDRDRS